MLSQPGSALHLLFGRILKWVYFYVYALRDNVYTASSMTLRCSVFHDAYIIMLLQEVSLRAGLCHNVKKYCHLHLPCEMSAVDKSVFNVILQQCDGCEEWHLSVQFDLHPRSNNTKCWCSLYYDDVPKWFIGTAKCVSASLTSDRFIVPGSV